MTLADADADAERAGRLVLVPAERLEGWVGRFGTRHGTPELVPAGPAVLVTAPDGATATIEVPLADGSWVAGPDLLRTLVAAAVRERTVGAVLVRRGGFAVGLFTGRRLVASKVGRGYVQGQTKAGGWSQQRYARRRENQANQSYAVAADTVAAILLPHLAELDAVVGGGDRAGVDAVLADPRLTGLAARRRAVVLPTPDPRLRVLTDFADQFRAVRVTIREPVSPLSDSH